MSRMDVPALVLTGEAALDRVVPVSMTQQYLRLWPHANTATIARSGHLGAISRPEEFADHLMRFAESTSRHDDRRRRIVG
jgi:pimeloyl-ACP methyl ester carboxylesterase